MVLRYPSTFRSGKPAHRGESPRIVPFIVRYEVAACVNFIAATRPGISLLIANEKIKELKDKYNASIESVYVPSLEAWLNIDFGSGSANPLSNGAKLYIDGVLLENLRVPESVSKIKPYAFSGYRYFKSFEITGRIFS